MQLSVYTLVSIFSFLLIFFVTYKFHCSRTAAPLSASSLLLFLHFLQFPPLQKRPFAPETVSRHRAVRAARSLRHRSSENQWLRSEKEKIGQHNWPVRCETGEKKTEMKTERGRRRRRRRRREETKQTVGLVHTVCTLFFLFSETLALYSFRFSFAYVRITGCCTLVSFRLRQFLLQSSLLPFAPVDSLPLWHSSF